MFRVVFLDIAKFLKHHFLASLIITITYFVLTKLLVDGSFENANPLMGYQFFSSSNFIANIFLYAVIISTIFLILIYFENHRRVDSKLLLSDLRDNLPKFVFGGLFSSLIIGLVFYISFLLGEMNLDSDNDFIEVIRSVVMVLGLILMLKSMILFFPVLYYEKGKTVSKVFRDCVKRSSWTLVSYFLLIMIVLHSLGFMVYYVFDVMRLFRVMGFGIEDLVQAYIHIMMMLSLISLYKNITRK